MEDLVEKAQEIDVAIPVKKRQVKYQSKKGKRHGKRSLD